MLGLPTAPSKLIQTINLCTALEKGSLAEKRRVAEKVSEIVISKAPENQNTIVILQC